MCGDDGGVRPARLESVEETGSEHSAAKRLGLAQRAQCKSACVRLRSTSPPIKQPRKALYSPRRPYTEPRNTQRPTTQPTAPSRSASPKLQTRPDLLRPHLQHAHHILPVHKRTYPGTVATVSRSARLKSRAAVSYRGSSTTTLSVEESASIRASRSPTNKATEAQSRTQGAGIFSSGDGGRRTQLESRRAGGREGTLSERAWV